MNNPDVINRDDKTIAGFGDEWKRFDQSELDPEELKTLFDGYFGIFPWDSLPDGAVGFDLGCGSGRWARCVAPRVKTLHCIDASSQALEVARRNLSALPNCELHLASVDAIPLPDRSMDFGYSLGVLHHIPDTAAGIRACVAKLKPGAPFLIYLYYAFDNQPPWFRKVWQASEVARGVISRSPYPVRYVLSQAIAAGVYLPLARSARLLHKLGVDTARIPLSFYQDRSFYTMRTDALDRFGTRLEQRFSADQIRTMLEDAGLERIEFGSAAPYWCAVGFRRR